MKNTFSKLYLAPLIVLALASFAMVTVVDAAGRGGGGGGGGGARAGGGGGGAHAGGSGGGGGGGGRNVQANNSSADVRTNNVRSTSVNNVNNVNVNNVNNVNVNRNVNVNVNGGGCCNGGWDNNYHPVATAAAIGATVAVTSAIVGSMVRTVPVGCVPVNYGGVIYQQCGTAWYQPQAGQYVVINPPY